MKALALVVALFFAHSASAVYNECESSDKKIKVQIDIESHPLDEEMTQIEVHTYMDSIDYGAGNVLKESISSEIHPNVEEWTQHFGQGISLRYESDDAGCNSRFEFEHTGFASKTMLCCTVK